MKRHLSLCLLSAVLLSGCSSFKLGAFAYCPHGQSCEFKASPPSGQGVLPGPLKAAGSTPRLTLEHVVDGAQLIELPGTTTLNGSCLSTIPERCSVWKTH